MNIGYYNFTTYEYYLLERKYVYHHSSEAPLPVFLGLSLDIILLIMEGLGGESAGIYLLVGEAPSPGQNIPIRDATILS